MLQAQKSQDLIAGGVRFGLESGCPVEPGAFSHETGNLVTPQYHLVQLTSADVMLFVKAQVDVPTDFTPRMIFATSSSSLTAVYFRNGDRVA